ncbi:hypothetical protein FBU30_001824 [Linnemannia zychae]|nr:hypothetical protein FBU30_001824 [Linnemannia zychae]
MAIFDPASDVRPMSARSSVDHERLSHRRTISRPPSIESINSANSVPFAPPPPPPPSAWKRFTNHFSRRVIKRHIKFIVAMYISSALTLITPIAHRLGTSPYLANVAVVFMHPSRTVGSQLEVTFFSVIGGILGAAWILPCQAAVAAFNQRYLPGGNTAAWAIEASWFFVGIWIITLYKTRYAKLNCTFLIFAIAGIFSLTRGQASMQFNFFDFWDLMGPLMIGIAICLAVSVLIWPETASEGLGRALNESMDTSRSLLNLSTCAFLLNHKTIALPKSAIDKAQAEVRVAQKKLYSAYREARYEVTYSRTNPADYKEVKIIVSAIMRHLASMSLVVQNERLLMLGHPDRDDEDLLTQSGDESDISSNTSDNCSDSENDSDLEEHGSRSHRPSESNSHSGEQTDYFGNATVESSTGNYSTPETRTHHRHNKKSDPVESPSTEDGDGEPRHHRHGRRRGNAAELRRIRQLLQRAENSTQAALKARQQYQENARKESLQQTFNFDHRGHTTAPPTPGGRGVFNVFGYHQAHRSKNLSVSSDQRTALNATETLRLPSGYLSNATTPNSSRPNSIYEEANMNTVKSFKSLFSTKSGSKFKPRRPSSLKAGFKPGNPKHDKRYSEQTDVSSSGVPLDAHYATMPAGSFSDDEHLNARHYRTIGGIRFGNILTDQQIRKAAEAYKKKQEKQAKLERKQAERERKAEEQAKEKQEQAVAAARAVPPKEVAFGDRKLFMSFLDIVRDPLQRLSDSCSRVMVALEIELVAGLNVEQDRLERIQRRNAQREAAIRAAEANKAEDEKAAATGATVNSNVSGDEAKTGETPKGKSDNALTAWDRLRILVGVKPHKLSKEDLAYAEALKSSMGHASNVGEKSKKDGKKGKDPRLANAVHPNKLLHTSSGLEEDGDIALPPGMSFVQYLTQELEIFDKAEARGLQDFIATHPTLDVGPREEIFLIFFFLFSLREIARELLRLGKYVEELQEIARRTMELEGRTKRRKKLWWPKVFGNFWHWFAWGSYSQVKTSEGYNSLIRNSTKNLEHRQPRTIDEEKAIVEAKAARAAEAAIEASVEKKEEIEDHALFPKVIFPLRRTATLSNFIRRKSHAEDLERGRDDSHHQYSHGKSSQERRSRSITRPKTGSEWTLGRPRRHHSHQRYFGNSQMDQEIAGATNKPTMDISHILRDDLQKSPEEEKVDIPEKKTLKPAGQYFVREIPSFKSLQHNSQEDQKRFSNTNQIELLPRTHVPKPSSTAPPELDVDKLQKHISKKSSVSPDSNGGEGPSTAHQASIRVVFPKHTPSSNSSSISPALHLVQNPNSDPKTTTHHRKDPYTVDSDSTDSDIDHPSKQDKKSRTRNLFSGFSRHHSSESDDSESSLSSPVHRSQPPAPEPAKPPRAIFIQIPKPKTWRYWLWEQMLPFKSEEFKFGFKMAFALTFIGLWSWLQWNSLPLATDRGQWAMLTVIAVLSPTIGATFSVCAMRVAGTLAGTLWALLTYLALPRNPWVICVFLLFVSFASAFLILETAHPKLGIIMLLSYSSVTLIKYEDYTSETIYEVCYKRSITVITGIIISVAMNSLLWPILARRELRKEIAVLIGRQGVLFAELVNKFFLEDHRDHQDHTHYVANWPGNGKFGVADNDDDDDDGDDYKEDNNEKVIAARNLEDEHVHDSFIERAERAQQAARMLTKNHKTSETDRSRSESHSFNSQDYHDSSTSHLPNKSDELPHQVPQNYTDPDRLAFQHVEQQLQTKLIKINQLLELSESEPRLKEDFPVKLYSQIIQCCQNILDRMVSMRMAAQLISPEVRELVTGPMNYYRRDMVGALLLYFSVLSSSLASKSPLPPYLPSARVARLRVIYNVREAIAAHQAITKEDHYTYIYYYAFSSALEEVIEELELLAILIKPIVGVTLVSSGHQTYNDNGAFPADEFNFGTAVQTDTMGLPDATTIPHPAPGAEILHGQKIGVHLHNSSPVGPFTTIPSKMVNVGPSDSTNAGIGAGVFGYPYLNPSQSSRPNVNDLEKGPEEPELEYPYDLIHQQQQKMKQDQCKMQQMQQQLEEQQKLIQQQRLQIQQQQLAYNFHPDLVIAGPSARSPLAGITGGNSKHPGGTFADESGSQSSLHSEYSATGPVTSIQTDNSGSSSKDKRPSMVESGDILSAQHELSRHKNKSTIRKHRSGGLHADTPQDISATTAQPVGGTPAAAIGGIKLQPETVAIATSPIIMMDESLLGGGRHSQRFKEAIQVAQEASGQKVIEVQSPGAASSGTAVIPAQVQLPMGAYSTGSTTKKGSSHISSLLPKIKISPTNPSATGSSGNDIALGQQQRTQRPSIYPTGQQSQSSASGHGYKGSLSTDSIPGVDRPSMTISTTSAAPFVLSLPARVVVPASTVADSSNSSSLPPPTSQPEYHH